MRTLSFCFVAVLIGSTVVAQTPVLENPSSFRGAVDLQTSLGDVDAATEDMAALEELAQRVLILDGVASTITVFSEDPADFYIEMELVGGRWDGFEEVTMFKAYVFFDDPAFSGRLAERAPRDPDPTLIVRNDRVLIAGRLTSLAEDPEGRLVPVVHAYDVRPLR